ncbi:hypothetical protein DRO53_04905 [Candidatus Bathyarchaeota archaeon]|nr:MAG: hypothetical protein DRO53_04905 [Candidatus Bathyarchaeota archaeon]
MLKVKPEIRVMAVTGVQLKRLHLLGVVFRGGSWLDGLVKMSTRSHPVKALNRMIKSSGHYGQVRVVLADAAYPWRVKFEDWGWLAEKLSKPVILFCEKPCKGLSLLKAGFGRVWVKAFKLSLQESLRVIEVSTALPPLPEPLRVARMLAASLTKALGNRVL